jgi:hypothetical protein
MSQRGGWTRAALMPHTVEQMFEYRNKLSAHAGGHVGDGRCRHAAGSDAMDCKFAGTLRALEMRR